MKKRLANADTEIDFFHSVRPPAGRQAGRQHTAIQSGFSFSLHCAPVLFWRVKPLHCNCFWPAVSCL
eukprot:SAG22_NODE_175_length_16235_cov_67.112729_12_plen_67_part_00